MKRYKPSVTPILPGYRCVFTPWAHPLIGWSKIKRLEETNYKNVAGLCQNSEAETLPVESLSNLTLHPAPGEMFALKFTVADELLNEVPATLKISVS